jgi:hypothetical protein
MLKRFLLVLLLPIASVLVASCGGGGGGGAPVAGLGTSGGGAGTVVSSGPISGFGSVFLNGVRHQTNAAAISDDDAEDSERIGEDKLKVGQLVEIKGRSLDASNSQAEIMERAAEVKGPVDKVFVPATKTLVVMGQTVLIDNNTVVDNNLGTAGVAGLKISDLVEVHGFRDAAGVITATRIELQGPVTQFRVRGTMVIGSLNTAAKTFKIGDLTVDYAAAQIVPTGTVLAEGQRVRVRAQLAPVAGKLTAAKVKVKKLDDAGQAELEGVINKFASAIDFEINGNKVTTTAATIYEKGVVADLKLGAKVEAKGAVANGVLTASKIEFKSKGDNKGEDSARVKIAGLVSAASLASNTVTVLGQTFKVTPATHFEDRVANTRPFNITNFDSVVKSGVHVQITAFKSGADLIASRIEVNSDSGAVVQGVLAAGATNTKLTIQGVDVTIDSGTKFFNADDTPFTNFAAFIVKAPAGTIVKAKSKATPVAGSTSIVATGANQGEVEIED